jgi:hypothetical protein
MSPEGFCCTLPCRPWGFTYDIYTGMKDFLSRLECVLLILLRLCASFMLQLTRTIL